MHARLNDLPVYIYIIRARTASIISENLSEQRIQSRYAAINIDIYVIFRASATRTPLLYFELGLLRGPVYIYIYISGMQAARSAPAACC